MGEFLRENGCPGYVPDNISDRLIAFPDDEYAFSLYADQTTQVNIKDLGVKGGVTFALPIDAFKDDYFDLRRKALRAGRKDDVVRVLGRQLAVYESNKPYAQQVKSGFKHDLRAARLLRKGQEDTPFFVAQTTGAILQYGVSEDVDPRIFRDRVINIVDRAGFAKAGTSDEEITNACEAKATLVGAVFVGRWDSMGDAVVFMRPRSGAWYGGCYTLPGGHYDWLGDIAPLREVIEEQCLPPDVLRKAVPLGTVNQVIPNANGSARRYLALVWKLPLDERGLLSHVMPRNGDEQGEWEEIPYEYLSRMSREGKLTPIAQAALQLDRYEGSGLT